MTPQACCMLKTTLLMLTAHQHLLLASTQRTAAWVLCGSGSSHVQTAPLHLSAARTLPTPGHPSAELSLPPGCRAAAAAGGGAAEGPATPAATAPVPVPAQQPRGLPAGPAPPRLQAIATPPATPPQTPAQACYRLLPPSISGTAASPCTFTTRCGAYQQAGQLAGCRPIGNASADWH